MYKCSDDLKVLNMLFGSFSNHARTWLSEFTQTQEEHVNLNAAGDQNK